MLIMSIPLYVSRVCQPSIRVCKPCVILALHIPYGNIYITTRTRTHAHRHCTQPTNT
jgi:hypothetical protein